MQKPDRSSYTPLDFATWRESRALDITPKFQRRAVWSTAARSFLIDTILRGMPVPPIYLRVSQSEDKKRTVREVIDGQQRISALLDFLEGSYALSTGLDSAWSGRRFSELTSSEQDAIRQYSFICETFHGISDAEVLEIFARLNTYAVKLNAQELRNGKYFGFFKRSAYALAYEHVEFWRSNRIFTETGIARMLEVELTSELMIAELDGIQDKKGSIDKFYANKDLNFPEQPRVEDAFRQTIDSISESLRDTLARSEFRRVPLFYSLFSVVYHRQFGLPKLNLDTPRKRLRGAEQGRLLNTVTLLSDVLQSAREGEAIADDFSRFVAACLRQTDNIQPRRTRIEQIYAMTF